MILVLVEVVRSTRTVTVKKLDIVIPNEVRERTVTVRRLDFVIPNEVREELSR